MPPSVAHALLALVALYAGAGALFAALFHAGGCARIDADAARGTWGFRILVTPGVVLLWPILLPRWWRAAGAPPVPRDAHREAAARNARPDAGRARRSR